MKNKKEVTTGIIIGIVIGVLLVGVPVMAVSYISSRDISYKTDYNENVTNVEEALDILTNQVNEINNTGDSSSNDILSGKTAYVNGKLLTGSMANYGGTSISASNIRENGSNAEISIPDGYYDKDSKINIPLNTIEQLPTIGNIDNIQIIYSWQSAGGVWNDPYLKLWSCMKQQTKKVTFTNYAGADSPTNYNWYYIDVSNDRSNWNRIFQEKLLNPGNSISYTIPSKYNNYKYIRLSSGWDRNYQFWYTATVNIL